MQLAPWRWEAAQGRLARGERLGEAVGEITVEQRGSRALSVVWRGFGEEAVPEILRRVGRWVSADWDPAPAVAALGPVLPEEAALVARGGRILRCSTFYEDFVKTVLTINTNWPATLRMSAALIAEPGGGAFPGPMAILDYGEARLREGARLGFRATTVVAATRRLLADGMIDAEGREVGGQVGHDYLTGLKGIGPYAAAHCALLLHDFSRIPVDTVAVADLRARYGQDPAQFAAARAGCGAYLALGYRLSRLREKLGQEAAQ